MYTVPQPLSYSTRARPSGRFRYGRQLSIFLFFAFICPVNFSPKSVSYIQLITFRSREMDEYSILEKYFPKQTSTRRSEQKFCSAITIFFKISYMYYTHFLFCNNIWFSLLGKQNFWYFVFDFIKCKHNLQWKCYLLKPVHTHKHFAHK